MTEAEERRGALIYIDGIPGTGKSTLGDRVQKALKSIAVLIDSDRIWLSLLGRSEEQPLEGGDINMEMHAKVTQVVVEETSAALRKGKIVIIPTAFADQNMRDRFEDLASREQVPFCGVFLVAPKEVVQQRAATRQENIRKGLRDPYNVSAVMPRECDDPVEMAKTISWIPVDAMGSPATVFNRFRAISPFPVPMLEEEEPCAAQPAEAAFTLTDLSREGPSLQQVAFV